jgi:hypothetical protein
MVALTPFDSGSAFEENKNNRLESLKRDIAIRLSKACRDLTEDDFAALVEKIARVQMRGEGRSR